MEQITDEVLFRDIGIAVRQHSIPILQDINSVFTLRRAWELSEDVYLVDVTAYHDIDYKGLLVFISYPQFSLFFLDALSVLAIAQYKAEKLLKDFNAGH